MKALKLIAAAFPILMFASVAERDLFPVDDKKLMHIAFDQEEDFIGSLTESLGSLELGERETSELGFLEIDENSEELLPWSAEKLSEDLSSYIEKKAKQVMEEYDDVFSYEITYPGRPVQATPTLERVPEKKNSLFSNNSTALPSKSEEKVTKKNPSKKEFIINNLSE